MNTPKRTPFCILAADIGGTHARFARVEVEVGNDLKANLGAVFTFATRQAGISTFAGFWDRFRSQAPAELSAIESFDAVSLAVAGSVTGQAAVLPNIDWDITPQDARLFHRLFLVNDFVAQGHALTATDALASLEKIRGGEPGPAGVIALVGAGTGLGHCALHPLPPGNIAASAYHVAGSEAGHASFAFQGGDEKIIEQRWLQRTGRPWLSNDDVVSGPGAVQLHACLTGKTAAASEALAPQNPETGRWFSRFYGRACRNFCLNVFPVSCLVLSGGIAARSPHLVRSEAFSASFNDGLEYRELLARVPIRLNTDPYIGIRGAAIHAARALKL